MFIRKLCLKNLRSHTDTTLDLARLTVIRGANSVGKSSVEQALEIALAGRTDATTADGKGSAGLVRAGEQKALVALTIDSDDGIRLLQCAISNASKRTVLVSRPNDATYSGGEEWKAGLELHRDTLSCLINNRFFVDLKPDAQADLLASIVLPKTCEWPQGIRQAAHDCELSINWARAPFEILAQGYDLAFKERTGVNRDIKNFALPAGDTAPAEHLESASHRLGELRTELEALKKQKYDLEGHELAKQKILAAADKSMAEAQRRLENAERDAAACENEMLSEAKRKDHEKLAKNTAKAEKEDKEIARLGAEIDLKNQTIQRILALRKSPTCPTCNTALTEDALVAIVTPLNAEVETLRENQTAAFERRRVLGDPAESQKLLDAHQRAGKDLGRARQRADDERTLIRAAQANLDEIANQPKIDVSGLDAQITELDSRIHTGEERVRQARDAKELIGRIARAREQQGKLVRKQAQLEKLVEYFGTEARAKLLAESLGAFTESMNHVLGNWGYQCSIAVDPYRFALAFQGSEVWHEIPLAQLSKSQRYRFAVAFQVALAITTGFKFVVVDEADIFDARSRAGLFAALNSGQLDQAIVIGTDERQSVPNAPDTAFYMLSNTAEPGMIPTTHARKLEPAVAAVA